MPTFHFDEVINPLSAYQKDQLVEKEIQFLNDTDFEEFEMPEDVDPIFSDEPLYN